MKTRIHKILVIDDDVELYEVVAEYPRTRRVSS